MVPIASNFRINSIMPCFSFTGDVISAQLFDLFELLSHKPAHGDALAQLDHDREPYNPSHTPPTDLFDLESGGNCPAEFFDYTISGYPPIIANLFQIFFTTRRKCDCFEPKGGNAHVLSEMRDSMSVLKLPLPDGNAGQPVAMQELLDCYIDREAAPQPSTHLCHSACSVACANALHTRLELPVNHPVTIDDVESYLLTEQIQLQRLLTLLEPHNSQIELLKASMEPACFGCAALCRRTADIQSQLARWNVGIHHEREQMTKLFDQELHTTVALAVEVKNNFLVEQIQEAKVAVASNQPNALNQLDRAERALTDFARTMVVPLAEIIKEATKALPRGHVTESREFDPQHPPHLLVVQLARLDLGEGNYAQCINNRRVAGIETLRFLGRDYSARVVALKQGSTVGSLHYTTAVESFINGNSSAFSVDNASVPHLAAINSLDDAKSTFEADACVIMYERHDGDSMSVVNRVVVDAAPLPVLQVPQQVRLLLLVPLLAA